ncbi:MAG: hypothetical protein ACI8RN_002285 [Glaciecola sp.]|jgi:hypothetical protein|uniref:sulfotransferase family protein n=1 Tax=Congregibacter sp. TaxID=2744308 RepID=UPI0039E3C909
MLDPSNVSKPDGLVFNIGLPKTGTSSLCAALNILEIPAIHNPLKLRMQTLRGDYDLDRQGKWQAICNFGEHCYPQLDQKFPGSKFILTVRALPEWLVSIERQLGIGAGFLQSSIAGQRFNVLRLNDWRRAKAFYTGRRTEFRRAYARIEVFGAYEFSEDRYAFVYEEHLERVKRYFIDRSDDLLIMNVSNGDGWEKLCAFLGRPVPKGVEFPRTVPVVSR